MSRLLVSAFMVLMWAASSSAQTADPKLLERAKALLDSAPLIDTHNDLPSHLLEQLGGDLTLADLSKIQLSLSADVPRLREGHVGAQYWAVFAESDTMRTHTSLREAVREFDVPLRFIRSQPALELARTADDIDRIHKSGRISSLLGVEGGHMIENSSAAIRIFQELGARYLTLTHWNNVEWADAATDRADHDGLTKLGEQFVRELNRVGMFVDLSHVSAETMRDALRVTRAPVIFSHSNAFAIVPHPRNVPDDVLRLLAANGGVVHVNFIREYASPKDLDWQAQRRLALEDLRGRLETEEAIAKAIAEWEKAHPHPRGGIADVADHIDPLLSKLAFRTG